MFIHNYTYVCMYVCIYVYNYVSMYGCMCIHIFAQSHVNCMCFQKSSTSSMYTCVHV